MKDLVMSEGYIRKISELVTRYELEPEIKDIYYEGPSDYGVLNYFKRGKKLENLEFYDIDTIEFDIELNNDELSFIRDNKKNALILMATKIEFLNDQINQVRCLIDRDFDFFFDEPEYLSLKLIITTDYTSSEMYFLNFEVIEKFVELYCFEVNINIPILFFNLIDILQKLFLIRVTFIIMKIKRWFVEFNRCLEFDQLEKTVNLKFDDYIDRCLNKANLLAKKKEFLKIYEENEKLLTKDPRNQIYGHDYPNLLSRFLLFHGINFNVCNEKSCQRGIRCCFEMKDVENENLFINIYNWVMN
jgi:hypothetical protein